MIFYCSFYFEKKRFFIEGWGCFVSRSMIFRVLLKFDNCIVIMDHMCVGRDILIWMLFSVTLGNPLFLHIMRWRLIISKFVTFNVWGLINFVDFVEEKKRNILVDCFE